MKGEQSDAVNNGLNTYLFVTSAQGRRKGHEATLLTRTTQVTICSENIPWKP